MKEATSVVVMAALLAAGLAGCKMTDGQKNVAFLAGREVQQFAPDERPSEWARPVHLVGVPNLQRVSDDLYRGDEPTEDGMENLAAMGIRTVVCVRALHSTQAWTWGLPLKYEQINMWAWEPQDQYVVHFLRIMKDPANRPVFIHCYTGGDRAGLFVAVYRVAFCGWSKDAAKREMLYGGAGFHQRLIKYLVPYFDALDIDEMKRQAGVTEFTAEHAARPT